MVDCVECEFEAVRNSKLVKNVMQMILYGRLANEKLFTYFLVTKALGHELDNLLLAFTEKMFFAARPGFRRLGKSFHHFSGHAVIQPDFSGMCDLLSWGEYLCEVRAKQYWRLENLKSFDQFLENRFADSGRKAYSLMTIHEHLTRVPKPQL